MASTLLSKMRVWTLTLLTFSSTVNAIPYYLTRSYSGATFFNNFNFMTTEPAGGFVTYVDQATAQGLGYAKASANKVYIGVDHTSVLNPSGPGRRAVRIESKESFNQGLFIGDFSHMPWGCGTWPAFWMYGPNWPFSGEIDILEGVNEQWTNQVSAHTSDGCVIAGSNAAGQLVLNNCYDPVSNSGCFFKARGAYTYGPKFNEVGGGVYAMQWTSDWISVYFFRRDRIPADIKSDAPNPSTWGKPMATFAGSGANIAGRFANMKIVVNTDFCGPWASAVWGGACPGSSCVNHVASKPDHFKNAYWSINSIKVYQPSGPVSRLSGFNSNSTAEAGNATEPESHVASSSLSFSSVTPLASISSVFRPDAALGATISAVIGPAPTTTSSLVISLPLQTETTTATATASATATSS